MAINIITAIKFLFSITFLRDLISPNGIIFKGQSPALDQINPKQAAHYKEQMQRIQKNKQTTSDKTKPQEYKKTTNKKDQIDDEDEDYENEDNNDIKQKKTKSIDDDFEDENENENNNNIKWKKKRRSKTKYDDDDDDEYDEEKVKHSKLKKKRKGKKQNLSPVIIKQCVSCAYKQNFEGLKNSLLQEFPRIHVEGINQPPNTQQQMLAYGVRAIQFSLLILLSFGQQIEQKFNIRIPDIIKKMQANKWVAMIAIWFLGNMLQGNFMASGAFEVEYEGKTIWSKLRAGRFPDNYDIISMLKQSIGIEE